MKIYRAVTAAMLLIGILPTLHAADKPKAVDLDSIKDKVGVTLREDFAVEFKRDGDRLLQPSKAKASDAKKGAVRIKLGVTSASPAPPPREGATRPYLEVGNDFGKTLHFRAVARLKGSKEFFEIMEAREPLPAGDTFQKCWEFDSLVEEVVVYEFKLSDERAK